MNLKRGRDQAQSDDSVNQRRISDIPQIVNVKQSLQVLRRTNNRLKASAIKKKQHLSTQILVDHVNTQAGVFDAIDHSNEEPINVFTIEEQRNSDESSDESNNESADEDYIEDILSPSYIPTLLR